MSRLGSNTEVIVQEIPYLALPGHSYFDTLTENTLYTLIAYRVANNPESYAATVGFVLEEASEGYDLLAASRVGECSIQIKHWSFPLRITSMEHATQVPSLYYGPGKREHRKEQSRAIKSTLIEVFCDLEHIAKETDQFPSDWEGMALLQRCAIRIVAEYGNYPEVAYLHWHPLPEGCELPVGD